MIEIMLPRNLDVTWKELESCMSSNSNFVCKEIWMLYAKELGNLQRTQTICAKELEHYR